MIPACWSPSILKYDAVRTNLNQPGLKQAGFVKNLPVKNQLVPVCWGFNSEYKFEPIWDHYYEPAGQQ